MPAEEEHVPLNYLMMIAKGKNLRSGKPKNSLITSLMQFI